MVALEFGACGKCGVVYYKASQLHTAAPWIHFSLGKRQRREIKSFSNFEGTNLVGAVISEHSALKGAGS